MSNREPLFRCGHCLDTSLRPFRCDGHNAGERGERDPHLPMFRCGRMNTHQPHGYVERCECWFRAQPRPEAA